MLRILIVEDEEPINNLIYLNLKNEGYACTRAYDGEQAADLIEENVYDLVLLDIMLPKIDGYELLDYIRPTGTPVIFITAMGQVSDRIRGLRLGADARPHRQALSGRRTDRARGGAAAPRGPGKTHSHYELFGVTIDADSRTVKKDGDYVELTVKEFDLLMELVRNKNIALYREQLYERVWHEPFTGETRTLDLSHPPPARQARIKGRSDPRPVFRIGYRLEV